MIKSFMDKILKRGAHIRKVHAQNGVYIAYERVRSVYNEANCPSLDARILEYYQFEMQPVSIMIIQPNNRQTGVADIGIEHVIQHLPGSIHRFKEKRITAVLPANLVKQLDKARAKLAATRVRNKAKHAPQGEDFRIGGQYMVVVCVRTSGFPIEISRVYGSNDVSKSMQQLIKEYKSRDDKLMSEASESRTTRSDSIVNRLFRKKASAKSSKLTISNVVRPSISAPVLQYSSADWQDNETTLHCINLNGNELESEYQTTQPLYDSPLHYSHSLIDSVYSRPTARIMSRPRSRPPPPPPTRRLSLYSLHHQYAIPVTPPTVPSQNQQPRVEPVRPAVVPPSPPLAKSIDFGSNNRLTMPLHGEQLTEICRLTRIKQANRNERVYGDILVAGF